MTTFRALSLILMTMLAMVAAASRGEAATGPEIDADVNAALTSFESQIVGARELASKTAVTSLSMFGVALPSATPSSLKPGSPQPTSSSRNIMILGFLPLFAAKLASLFIRNDGVGGSNPLAALS
jgi:hypothetical protein